MRHSTFWGIVGVICLLELILLNVSDGKIVIIIGGLAIAVATIAAFSCSINN